MKRDPNASVDQGPERERGVPAVAADPRVGRDGRPTLPGGALSTSDEEWAEFQRVTQPARRAETAKSLGVGTAAAYLAVRQVAEPLLEDRVLEPDIRAVRRIIADETLLATVSTALPGPLRATPALSRGPSEKRE